VSGDIQAHNLAPGPAHLEPAGDSRGPAADSGQRATPHAPEHGRPPAKYPTLSARGLLLIFLIAAVLRIGLVLATSGQDSLFPDEGAYLTSARSLAEGDGLIDEFGYRATYMPGYPAFLALFQGLDHPLFWARLVQAFLAAWVAPATMWMACEWMRLAGRPVGERSQTTVLIIAGLLAACNPFLVYFSRLLLTEALYAAVLVSAWALVLRLARVGWSLRATVAAGVLLWMAIMLRPAAAPIALAAPILLFLIRRDLKSFVAGSMLVLIIFVGLAPWAARNRIYVGRWEFLTTRGGISLYDGLQPRATGESDLAHTKTMAGAVGLGETEWDNHFRALALREARKDPVRVLRLAGAKFLRTWSLRPHVDTHREGGASFVSTIWIVTVLILAGVGWWANRSALKAWALLLAPVILTTAMHMVFVGSIRYRIPVTPMMFVLAGAGFARLTGPGRHHAANGQHANGVHR
jgi:4-amino-4-deoxy-L-arabinose transferase-like glycosyltransferase